MSKYNHLFSATAARLIQEFCKPLHKIALTGFMHDITFGKGQITMLVNNADVVQFYYQNRIPMLCTDDSGRTLSNGIYLNRILEKQYPDCSVLMPLMVQVAQQFNQNFGKNSLHVVVREPDCQHLYSLFFDLKENDFLHWVVNNGDLLQDLIANYNTLAKDIILEAKSSENRIVLPNFNLKNVLNCDLSISPLNLFHKKSNMPIHLSEQQNRCLHLLMKGKSAKEIANDMRLSHRTVEHYLERIRNILGCTSNKELIISYYDQII